MYRPTCVCIVFTLLQNVMGILWVKVLALCTCVCGYYVLRFTNRAFVRLQRFHTAEALSYCNDEVVVMHGAAVR